MQKTFLGSELVKEKDKKKAQKKSFMPIPLRALKVLLGIVVGLVVWNLPSSVFGIENLTVIEQRVIAVFCFATLMWITEGIPSWATSVAIIVILLFTASDNSLSLFRLHTTDNQLFGTLMSSKKIMACFADPVIMLFIGGFMLAFAATKAGLDIKLAKALLKPFGTKSENVLLGFILVTGIFSMFLSNTATAAMMLTFLTPVIKSLPTNGKGPMCILRSVGSI